MSALRSQQRSGRLVRDLCIGDVIAHDTPKLDCRYTTVLLIRGYHIKLKEIMIALL